MNNIIDKPIVVHRGPVPFFRQLRDEGRSDDDLSQLRSCLDLSRQLVVARIDFDGSAAISHFIGSASVAAHLGVPTTYVGFALLHNMYRSGAFPDGKPYGDSPERRSLIRSEVGSAIEELVHSRYQSCTTVCSNTDLVPTSHHGRMLMVDLAELYEKWENGRIFAASADRADRHLVAQRADQLVEQARTLAGDSFALQLDAAFKKTDDLPEAARSGLLYGVPGKPYDMATSPEIRRAEAFEKGRSAASRIKTAVRTRAAGAAKRPRPLGGAGCSPAERALEPSSLPRS
ncbi:MAG: hypothetical protein ACI8Y4_004160 [Candidatus Poriferisodalaceae bacterium]|jgi:hypothetical protein